VEKELKLVEKELKLEVEVVVVVVVLVENEPHADLVFVVEVECAPAGDVVKKKMNRVSYCNEGSKANTIKA